MKSDCWDIDLNSDTCGFLNHRETWFLLFNFSGSVIFFKRKKTFVGLCCRQVMSRIIK
uniref:Uncharacterized protein n=1 Tax=Anguilla anguilla TaxID=7936 RepID=A0A0E9WM82_ANGAN